MKYISIKPVDAIRFTCNNQEEIIEWLCQYDYIRNVKILPKGYGIQVGYEAYYGDDSFFLWCGDYIIKKEEQGFEIMADHDFEEMYRPIKE